MFNLDDAFFALRQEAKEQEAPKREIGFREIEENVKLRK